MRGKWRNDDKVACPPTNGFAYTNITIGWKLDVSFFSNEQRPTERASERLNAIISSGEIVDLIFPDHVIASIPYLQEIGNASMRIYRLLIVYQILAHGNDVTLTLHHFH